MHHCAVAGPDVGVVEGGRVDCCAFVLLVELVWAVGEWETGGEGTYVGHNVLAQVGVCVAPRGAVGDHVIGTRSP